MDKVRFAEVYADYIGEFDQLLERVFESCGHNLIVFAGVTELLQARLERRLDAIADINLQSRELPK